MQARSRIAYLSMKTLEWILNRSFWGVLMEINNLVKSCSIAAVFFFVGQTQAAVVAPFVSGEMGYSTESSPSVIWQFDAAADTITIGNAQVDIGANDLSLLPSELIAPVSFNYGVGFVPLEIWNTGGFSFVLETVTALFEFGSFLVLEGDGIIYSNTGDFLATSASWEFSGNNLTFSAATIAQPAVVPVPAAFFLFASAVLTLPLARLKNKLAA